MLIPFFIHLAATGFMTGLIWFVQVVHYPLYLDIDAEKFIRYQSSHVRRTMIITFPVMMVELLTGALLFFESVRQTEFMWVNMILLLIIWGSTFVIQVPIHTKLKSKFDIKHVKTLINSNWIRTIAWTCRFGILIYMIIERYENPA